MPGSLKTEAIVLRSIRYGEGDRVLHLYTPHRGRLSAIAKGARKARSRFGGRLEPFFRLHLVLYEGRGDMLTVTSAETAAAHPRLRDRRRWRWIRRRARATRWHACSSRAIPTRRPTTCWPTSSRCWTPTRPAAAPPTSSRSGSSSCSRPAWRRTWARARPAASPTT